MNVPLYLDVLVYVTRLRYEGIRVFGCFPAGWEKAEAEAVSLKAQLDAALQQKLATEDRVAHLDGALKECMKQLRHFREENEQRVHDTLLKKTREYDKLRLETEAKLAESSHFLAQSRSELLESRAEVTALGHALQVRVQLMHVRWRSTYR